MLSYFNAHAVNGKFYSEMVALSTDVIDTTDVANGSKLYLMDTAKGYRWDEDGAIFRQINGSGTYTPPSASALSAPTLTMVRPAVAPVAPIEPEEHGESEESEEPIENEEPEESEDEPVEEAEEEVTEGE